MMSQGELELWYEDFALGIEAGLKREPRRWRYRSSIARSLTHDNLLDDGVSPTVRHEDIDRIIEMAEQRGRWPGGWVDSLIPRFPPLREKRLRRAIPGLAYSSGGLTDEQHAEIKRRYTQRKTGHDSMGQLAAEFNVTRKLVKAIVEGRIYGMGKLTRQNVEEIRRRWPLRNFAATRTTAAALAREFGVSWTTIQDIIERRTWGHV